MEKFLPYVIRTFKQHLLNKKKELLNNIYSKKKKLLDNIPFEWNSFKNLMKSNYKRTNMDKTKQFVEVS